MKELVVPLCVLFVLATLLLPVPAAFLDFMLVANILLALLLLISTLYVSNPIKLSALPSLLLLTTMYRLALNVSTTRRILSGADPGQMIDAFGTVVVQGNILVGLIVFLVITLVQFIVIAKGSERVAEVAARFTLDAMPGKQMSIDADMRSGVIDVSEARRKRDALQIESRFYGALDGSMKFVKGDAVAGIVITAINLLGGIVMGVLVFDLELAGCLSKFSLYTVGDGLLSQIPALLNSLAAGMIVTRVTGSEHTTSLARDLLQQIGQVRAVKVLIACLAVVLSCMPGMPIVPFWVLAAILTVSCFFTTEESPEEGAEVASTQGSGVPPLLEIEICQSRVAELENPDAMTQAVDSWRHTIFQNHGLLLPVPVMRLVADLPMSFRIVVRGIPVRPTAKKKSPDGLVSAVIDALDSVFTSSAADLIDDVMTRRLLDQYEEIAAEQIAYVIPDHASVTTITTILRDLTREGVSIRSFDVIMQAIAESVGRSPSNVELLAAVRRALKRHICDRFGFFTSEQPVYQLEAGVDMELMRAVQSDQPIAPGLLPSLLAELKAIPENAILVASATSRCILRDLAQVHTVPITCLAVDELCSDALWQHAGTIGASSHSALNREGAACI